jgi:hypothetical protein
MLQPMPTSSSTWPIPADAPDLQAIGAAQAKTISNQEVLLHDYQGVLNTAQGIAATTGSVSAVTGTVVTILAVTGTIQTGATVFGAGVPANTTVVGQTSGTAGGNGTYTFSQTITSAMGTVLTFTPTGAIAAWPGVSDAPDLMDVVAAQTLVLRTQTSLLQQYQELLNVSETPVPA